MHSILSCRAIEFLVDLTETDSSSVGSGSLLVEHVPRPPPPADSTRVREQHGGGGGGEAVRMKHLRMCKPVPTSSCANVLYTTATLYHTILHVHYTTVQRSNCNRKPTPDSVIL